MEAAVLENYVQSVGHGARGTSDEFMSWNGRWPEKVLKTLV